MELTAELIRKHKDIVEATVKQHTSHSKKGKVFNVKQHEREVKQHERKVKQHERNVKKLETVWKRAHAAGDYAARNKIGRAWEKENAKLDVLDRIAARASMDPSPKKMELLRKGIKISYGAGKKTPLWQQPGKKKKSTGRRMKWPVGTPESDKKYYYRHGRVPMGSELSTYPRKQSGW